MLRIKAERHREVRAVLMTRRTFVYSAFAKDYHPYSNCWNSNIWHDTIIKIKFYWAQRNHTFGKTYFQFETYFKPESLISLTEYDVCIK